MESDGLLKHFKLTQARVEQNEMDSLEHFRRLTPDGLTRDDFFAEYVHVVLVAGFRYQVVEKLHPRLGVAFMGYDCDAIAKSPGEVRRALVDAQLRCRLQPLVVLPSPGRLDARKGRLRNPGASPASVCGLLMGAGEGHFHDQADLPRGGFVP